MEENLDTEDNRPRVEGTSVEDVGGVGNQPAAAHLMEVDLTNALGSETMAKVDVDVQFQSNYLCTLPGFLRILQVLMSVAALICVTSISFDGQSYLMNPGAWRFRVFIFTSIVSILTSFLLLMTHASTIHRMMPVDWLLLDIGICGTMTLLYLVATAMVGAAYHEFSNKSRVWLDRHVLLAGMILGFVCFGLYGCHLTTLLVRWRKRGIFQHRPLQLEDRHTGSIIS